MAKWNKGHLRLISGGVDNAIPDDNIEQEAAEFGGGGGGGPMEPGITGKDYTDARVAEAKSDLRADIVTLEGKIISRLDRMPTIWQLLSAVGAGVLATLAILAYAGDRSDSSADRAASIAASLARIEASSQNGSAPKQEDSNVADKSGNSAQGK